MSSGIYQIRNQISGKRYVGSAVNIRRRWWEHLSRLRHGQHENEYLQRAFDKYGESGFTFAIVECIADFSQLIPREQYYLDSLKPEYNICPIAGSPLGTRHTLETRRKMSKAWTPERRQAQGKARKDKPHSEETKEQISRALMGRSLSRETRKKMSESQKGKPGSFCGKQHSMKTRSKMSEGRKKWWAKKRAQEELCWRDKEER